ncbi:YjcZ family sporulation protein [Lysinibacillus sp. NPDC097195]|uniref:YjcZ family sporulation protein n=1 Tax=Lysinibacillus sp. NPDC097195 TaxID=3364141 RepID=UPI0038190EA3
MGYYGGNVGGNWNNNYCGNNYEYGNNNGYGSTFALIVVLFILLIIVGATFINNREDC